MKKMVKSNNLNLLILLFAIVMQCMVFGTLQFNSHPEGDEVFTYTLANTPYSFNYIDHTWRHLPQSNGWVDASILKYSYETSKLHKFDYSGVYWHQRIDNHPIIYYSLVHTVCSLFPETWEPYYAEFINIIFIVGIDIILIRLFILLTGEASSAAVAILMMVLMPATENLSCLQRMYPALAFFGLWYLFINIKFISDIKHDKKELYEMIICVLCGSLTHYYFYVYAASVTLFTLLFLIRKKQYKFVMKYLISGLTAISMSLVIFPWMIWHIVFNQMNKHTDLKKWDIDKLKRFFSFFDVQLFGGRKYIVYAAAAILVIIWIAEKRNKKRKTINSVQTEYKLLGLSANIYVMTLGSAVLYSLVIFTLDDANWYYMTCFYIPFIIFVSVFVLKTLLVFISDKFMKHKDNVKIITADIIAACIVTAIVIGISPLRETISYKVKDYRQWNAFHDSVTVLSDHDCIYVEKEKSNLLSGVWFELGEYNEIKKETVKEYGDGDISKECLAGRKTVNDIVVFTSDDVNRPRLLGRIAAIKVASYGGVTCWEIK
jgi:hypothetical protein